MARFQPTVDIWSLDQEQIATLQRGQWVTAGGSLGTFCGVRPSGSVVVMWQGNAQGRPSYAEYRRTLMNYGRPQA